MSKLEWDQFFDLVTKICDGDGVWQDKCAQLVSAAEDRDCVDDWNELVSWFSV